MANGLTTLESWVAPPPWCWYIYSHFVYSFICYFVCKSTYFLLICKLFCDIFTIFSFIQCFQCFFYTGSLLVLSVSGNELPALSLNIHTATNLLRKFLLQSIARVLYIFYKGSVLLLQGLRTFTTKALYKKYKGSVQKVQRPCTVLVVRRWCFHAGFNAFLSVSELMAILAGRHRKVIL